jgi:hypothetical protein
MILFEEAKDSLDDAERALELAEPMLVPTSYRACRTALAVAIAAMDNARPRCG